MSVLSKNLHIGTTYAVKRNNELKQFRVTSIVSTKTGNSPSNINIRVHGILEGEGAVHFDKSAVLGEYTHYAELVERRKADDERQAQIRNERAEKARRAKALLTDLGIEARAYEYSGDVSIEREGIDKLIALLEGAKKHETV